MNTIAARFSAQAVGSVFIYTHEAHPGENYPYLASMEQKHRHGVALRDILGVTRPVLLDTLDGDCHRAFGSMPNMTWIFNKSGIPVYKSDWTDAYSVENALVYFLGVVQRRKDGRRLVPFTVERLDFREKDRDSFYLRLGVNGPKAVDEFRKAFGDD